MVQLPSPVLILPFAPGGGGVIRARSSKNACLWERACGGYNMEIPISLRLAVFKFYYSYLSDVF